MSEKAERANRKEMRRALGAGGLLAIDSHERAFELVRCDIVTEADARHQSDQAIRRMVTTDTAPLRRNLAGRLRWLFKGV